MSSTLPRKPNGVVGRLRRIGSKLGFERDWYLILVAMVIGLLMGGVAIAFILPLRLVEQWSVEADNRILQWLVPTAPVLGALAAGWVIYLLRSAGPGPGVSAVMYAVHRRKAQLPWTLGLRKWISSTLVIGSGGSAGAEGPIVTIGAVIGSNSGRLLRIGPQHRATLLGCGAAAGIAAVFNAPIAGVFFVMEILLRDFSLRTFTPIVIASVVASAFAQSILGDDPIFPITESFFQGDSGFTVLQIPNFLILGLICGATAATFIRGLYISEDIFSRIKVHPAIRPAIGAAVLGVLGVAYLLILQPGHHVPPFYGNGYPQIELQLSPSFYVDGVTGELKGATVIVGGLVAIAMLKALATCLTIGSGGSGGMFAPSLLMGASVGGAFGYVVNALNWFPAADPGSYALVGMGAVVAATTRAPLTAILIVYEITQSYETILPLMLAAVISTIVGRLIYRESVYTVKLTRAGVRIGTMSDLTVLRRMTVQDVPLIDPVVVSYNDSAQQLLDLSEQHHVTDFIVVDEHMAYCGMVTGADLKSALVYREAIPLLQVSELVRNDLPTVSPDDTLDVVLDRFSKHDVTSFAVLNEKHDNVVWGLITRGRLMQRYQAMLDEE